jgi:hypothetical protein
MRCSVFAVCLVMSTFGCDSAKTSRESAPQTAPNTANIRAPLVDLTASSTLAAVRTAFNAHKGEARFLTLLSPT